MSRKGRPSLRNGRLWEMRTMKNGLSANIVRYGEALDIDVMFETGQIVCKRKYSHFVLGSICCPPTVEIIGDYARITNYNTPNNDAFLLDVDDLPHFVDRRCHIDANGYAIFKENGKTLKVHRVIADAPPDMDVDHKNGIKTDNRKKNLRVCSSSENTQNQQLKVTNKSGYKGVFYKERNKKYEASICVDNKQIYLGLHDTACAAAHAYNEAAIKHHGAFARLNNV